MKIKSVFFLFIFITQSVWADLTCDISVDNYYAFYEINSYTCNPGQYLPANTLGCVSCPNGFTCPGGTFNFNADYFQGLSFETIPNNTMNNICANNFPGDLIAIYEVNIHNCSQGYYLPAGVDECRQCLENYYCPGGQLTFNETTPQGLNPCPNDTPYSPTGSISANQCYKIINLNWYLDENATIPLTVQPAAQKCIYGQKITLPDTIPTKKGYIFSGWRLRTTQPQQQSE